MIEPVADPWLPDTTRPWPDNETGPWLLTLHWQVVNGRPEAVGMSLVSASPNWAGRNGPGMPLRTSLLRQLNLAEIIAEQRTTAAATIAGQAASPPVPSVASMRGATVRRLSQAADIYRDAWRQGRQHPTKEVAARMGVTRKAATQLVFRAREVGLLSPTSPGRAGHHDPLWEAPDA